MGLFSWKCAKSGVEITHTMINTPAWTKEVVLLRPGKKPVMGDYDGYGRLYTEDGECDFWEEHMEKYAFGEKEPTLVLQRFYRGEKYEDLPPSSYGEWQGHFLPTNYDELAESLAKACEEAIESGKPFKPKTFTITVDQIADDSDLDVDDLEESPEGEYIYLARDEEHALEQLHSAVPMKNPEHFNIEVKENE
jgi:hypothetical protein